MSSPDEPVGVDLSSCDREPIHIPGSIQPHGALLALSEPALVVDQASANLHEVLGVPAREVLGRPVKGLLAPASVAAIRDALDGDRWAELNPLRIEAGGRAFDGIVHRYRAQNWLRIIPDRLYEPAPILPALRPDTGEPLDLSLAVLRSVSPIHLEYMANMGVRASMSISLVVRGHLWGLISCAHHSGPRLVPYALRSACEVLGRAASLQITAMEDIDAAEQRVARKAGHERLAAAMQGVDP